VPEFARILRESGLPPEKLRVISFNLETLRASKRELPKIEHYLLSGYSMDKQTGRYPKLAPLIAQARDAGFEGLNLNQDWPVSEEFVAPIYAAGLKLLVWTVDEPATARKWIEAGAVGVTTNRPGSLREQLAVPGR
jgi:glycerophosphoryl diester phosphodiesterase